MMNKFIEIIKHLCQAQIASDKGKNIEELKFENLVMPSGKKAYGMKTEEELAALRILSETENGSYGIEYSVHAEPDQNGYHSLVTIFQMEDGRQITFHTPSLPFIRNSKCWEELEGFVNDNPDGSAHLKWCGVLGGSRALAQDLINKYQL